MTGDVDPIEAKLEELDSEQHKPQSKGFWGLLTALLAAVTIGGFAAIIWYAYSTGVREGSEFAAPILKPDGPSKVAPAHPGGQQIADQDKLVYGKIDRSTEGRKVERLLPPPEKLLPAPIVRKLPPKQETKLGVPTAPPTLELKKPQAAKPVAVNKPGIEASNEAPGSVIVAPPTKPAASSPVKPKLPAVPSTATTPKLLQIAAKPGSLKGYGIQIGSFRSEAAAKAAWNKRLRQHGAILGKLKLLVRRVDLDKKGIFYRAQAGPLQDHAAAKRVCIALKKKKVSCLVSRL